MDELSLALPAGATRLSVSAVDGLCALELRSVTVAEVLTDRTVGVEFTGEVPCEDAGYSLSQDALVGRRLSPNEPAQLTRYLGSDLKTGTYDVRFSLQVYSVKDAQPLGVVSLEAHLDITR